MRHELVKLAALIDWEFFEAEWAGFFSLRPHKACKFVAAGGRALVSSACLPALGRSGGGALDRQFLRPALLRRDLLSASCADRFVLAGAVVAMRIGEEGVEWLLTKTIEAGCKSGAVDNDSLTRIGVDTTVMEKNIAHPTDARLYEKARRQLVALAVEGRIDLRQNYHRLATPSGAIHALRVKRRFRQQCAPELDSRWEGKPQT